MGTKTDAFIAARFRHASYRHIVLLRELFAGRVGGERVTSTANWVIAFENIKREIRTDAELRESRDGAASGLVHGWLAAAASKAG